jgi:pimeloyl-ACP methyl ester carboxylesterase
MRRRTSGSVGFASAGLGGPQISAPKGERVSTHPTTAEQIDHCNETGRTPVVFIHGLWLLPNSWDRWAALFEEAG